MAQINAQYPDLSQMFGQYSLNPTELGMQRFESAQNAENLNQQQALQDILYQQQNDPQKLQRAALENQGLEAGLPGLFAASGLKQDQATVSRQSLGEQIGAEKGKLAGQISDNDLKIIENSAQKMAMSQDPNERAIGVQLLQQHKDIVRDKAKQDAQLQRQLQLQEATGKTQKELMQMQIDAGRFVKAPRGGAGGSIEDQLKSGKLSFEKASTLLSGAAFMAEQEGDTEKADMYRQMADQYTQRAESLRASGVTAGQVGKPDVGAMTKGSVPTVQAKPVQPFAPVVRKDRSQQLATEDAANGVSFSSPAAEAAYRASAQAQTQQQAVPPKMDVQQLQKLYPGIPVEQLKAAYKKKFNIDL